MKLILVRHGETEGNIKDLMQGQVHGTLSRRGKSQARKLSRRLKKENIDIIYSSDLKRAKDTAKEIKRFHPESKIRFVKDLREQCYGEFDGKHHSLLDAHLKKNNITFRQWKPKGGESLKEKNRRAISFLKKTIRNHKDETILWVTHGGIIIPVLLHLYHLPNKYYRMVFPHNTAVSIIEFDKKKHTVHVLNCVKHL
jgi:broad specificity phosphatase PhoE